MHVEKMASELRRKVGGLYIESLLQIGIIARNRRRRVPERHGNLE